MSASGNMARLTPFLSASVPFTCLQSLKCSALPLSCFPITRSTRQRRRITPYIIYPPVLSSLSEADRRTRPKLRSGITIIFFRSSSTETPMMQMRKGRDGVWTAGACKDTEECGRGDNGSWVLTQRFRGVCSLLHTMAQG